MKLAIAAVALASACTTPSGPLTNGATRVQISRQGGLAPTAAAGSTCTPMDDRYTLTLATHVLSWQLCQSATGSDVFAFVPGDRTLSQDDFDQLVAALDDLHGKRPTCGGDVIDRIVFSRTSGDTVFDGAQCLENEDAVFELLYSDAP